MKAASGTGFRALALGAALSAGLIATLAAGAAYQLSSQLKPTSFVRISPLESLSWLGDFTIGLAAPSRPVRLSEPVTPPVTAPRHVSKKNHVSKAGSAAGVLPKRAEKKLAAPKATSKSVIAAKSPVKLESDRVESKQAAPILRSATSPSRSATEVDSQERAKLRSLAFTLRRQFYTAVVAPHPMDSQSIQVAKSRNVEATPAEAGEKSSAREDLSSSQKSAAAAVKTPSHNDVAPAVIQSVGVTKDQTGAEEYGPFFLRSENTKTPFDNYAVLLDTFKEDSVLEIAEQEARRTKAARSKGSPIPANTVSKSEPSKAGGKATELEGVSPEVLLAVQLAERERTETLEELPLALDLPVYKGNRKKTEYSKAKSEATIRQRGGVTIQNMPRAQKPRPRGRVSTQSAQPPVSTHAAAARVKEPEEDPVAPAKLEPASDHAAPGVPLIQKRYVEALSAQEVPSAVNDWSYSYEGSKEGAATRSHWRVASSPDHWKTLYWSRLDHGRVPMMSDGTAWILSRLADVEIQRETGMFIGRVASGWRVQFGGRSEPIIYLNDQQQRVADEDISRARYFVLLNVEPGSHLVHLHHPARGESAAVVAPSLEGVVTALDLSEWRSTKINGWVLGANGAEAKGIEDVKVRVVGRTGDPVSSDRSGAFVIPNAIQFAGMPLFLEADSAEGFSHRYQTLLDSGRDEHLYLFSESQISGWVSQLSGGVSPQSGLVIAALPGLIARHPDALRPSIQPILRNTTLVPETYVVTPRGQLKPAATVSPESPRFIGAQVPPGFVKARLRGKEGTAWSVLTVAAPRVLTVIGPN